MIQEKNRMTASEVMEQQTLHIPDRKLLVGLIGVHRTSDGHSTQKAGKDTVCRILIDQLKGRGIDAERVAFADALKTEVARAFDVPVEFIENRRKLWGPNYWIQRVRVKVAQSPAKVIVVTDCRFWDEIEFIRESMGLVVKVFRVSTESVPNGSVHASDQFGNQSIPDDYTVMNTGSIADLVRRTDDLAKFVCDKLVERSR